MECGSDGYYQPYLVVLHKLCNHPWLMLEDGVQPAAGMTGSFHHLVLKGNTVKRQAAYGCV